MKEKFKTIILDGDKTKYKISNFGYVLNGKTGKVLKSYVNTFGYEQVVLSHNGHRYPKQIHRLVAEYFLFKSDDKYQVNHKNGKKRKNNKMNLEWCTHSENQIHAIRTRLKDTSLSSKRIPKEKRDEIYDLLETSDLSLNKIAKKFNVSIVAISDIYHKKSYSFETKDRRFMKRSARVYNSGFENPNNKNSEQTIRRICELLEKDELTHGEIASICNVSKQLVSDIKSRTIWVDISSQYNIKKPHRPLTKDQINFIIKLIEEGRSTKEIIKIMNINSTNTIYNAISYYRRKYDGRL